MNKSIATLSIIIIVIISLLAIHPAQALSSCTASDLSAFRACIDGINTGAVDTVTLTSLIPCSGVDECKFVISNVHRNIIISGTTNSGFVRTSGFGYRILQIENSSNIQIGNITFDDSPSDICMSATIEQIVEDARCKATIFVIDSNDITFDSLTIKAAKLYGIQVIRTNNFILQNSFIIGSPIHAVYLGLGTNRNTSYKFINNLFQDIQSAGLGLAGSGTPTNPIVVNGNTFINNAYRGIFTGYPDAAIYTPNSDLQYAVISNNEIKDGPLLSSGYTNGGMEIIEDTPLHDVVVENNIIHDIAGCGLCIIRFQDQASNFFVRDNIIYNITTYTDKVSAPIVITQQYPGLPSAYGVKIFDNATLAGLNKPELGAHCFTSNCIPASAGILTAFPNPCLPSLTLCTTKITWRTIQGGGALVKANGSLFVSGNYGKQDAPWISINGVTFVLYNGGNQELASLTVRAVLVVVPTQTSTITVTPSPTQASTNSSTPAPTAVCFQAQSAWLNVWICDRNPYP